jgi:hypothetical protein
MRPDACIDDQFAAVAAQAPGRWIDVLLRQSLSPPTLTIASEARRCTALALGAVCRTGVVLAPDPERPASALAPLHDGERVDLTGAGDGRRLEGPGWSDPEAFGAWTEGKHALLVLPLAPDWEGGITVTAEARAYAPPPRSSQEVLASVNGHPIAHWRVLQEFGRFEAEVPRTLWTGGAIVLDLAIPGALSPYEAERAPDDRTLGIAVRSVTVRASH